jgi:hypothetical protein
MWVASLFVVFFLAWGFTSLQGPSGMYDFLASYEYNGDTTLPRRVAIDIAIGALCELCDAQGWEVAEAADDAGDAGQTEPKNAAA